MDIPPYFREDLPNVSSRFTVQELFNISFDVFSTTSKTDVLSSDIKSTRTVLFNTTSSLGRETWKLYVGGASHWNTSQVADIVSRSSITLGETESGSVLFMTANNFPGCV